jgi:sporulation protein YunB
VLFILSVIIIETTLQPILHSICETSITGIVTNIVHQAVNRQTDNLSYNDLVTIQTNRDGEIILMQPNLQIVNELSSNITLEVQEALENRRQKEVEIPISQIFGIEILARFVPALNVRIVPYSSVKSNLIDQFESVGINQTKHKIYLKITSKTKVIVPLMSTDIKVNTEVPLTEAVIVGQVPEVYVGVEEGLFKGEGGVIKQNQ